MALLSAEELYRHVAALYPITRSITGPGVRESLDRLAAVAPLKTRSVPTGTPVLDWQVPEEWVFREAFIEDPAGRRVVDTHQSNLHVVNFSAAVDSVVSFEELQPHLHSLADQPEAVPYRTAYYHRDWGFCLTARDVAALVPGKYRVRVNAEHRDGVLNYGELLIPGRVQDEILISTHICHPSLANDNVSGMVLAAALAAHLLERDNRFSWRFVFVPGTIGAISWLARNRDVISRIKGGLVITGLGDPSAFTWKRTVDGERWIDHLVTKLLAEQHPTHHRVIPFGPYGYDERQYCSPGFDLPVGRLTRAVHGTFPEYHTSNDNLDFVTAEHLAESLTLLVAIAEAAEADFVYRNLQPHGEPQLGRRGLYGSIGALRNPGEAQMAMLWMLNQSNGERSLLDVARRSGLRIQDLSDTAKLLEEHALLDVSRHATE